MDTDHGDRWTVQNDTETREYFYKYYSLAEKKHVTRIERLILSKEIHFSNRDQFNDPFDCKPVYRLSSSRSRNKRWLTKMVRSLWPNIGEDDLHERVNQMITKNFQPGSSTWNDLVDQIQAEIKAIGIYCLVKDPENLLMWSHYADSHKGVCVQFLADIESPGLEYFASFTLPVVYQEEYPVIEFPLPDGDGPKSEMLNRTFLTKGVEWKYENEHRFINVLGPGIRNFPSGTLNSIIFGAEIDKKARETLLDAIKNSGQNISAVQAKLQEESFGLTFHNIP